jgi:hypothetical protein
LHITQPQPTNRKETTVNIFFLDSDPRQAARDMCDKHVVKMIVEYAQMLSTAHHLAGSSFTEHLYKPAYQNHPSTMWVRESILHYAWLRTSWTELGKEYQARYGKTHRSMLLTEWLRFTPYIPDTGFFAPPQCMPDQYRVPTKRDPIGSTVKAYRDYYINEKSRFATWDRPNTSPPDWWPTHSRFAAQPLLDR